VGHQRRGVGRIREARRKHVGLVSVRVENEQGETATGRIVLARGAGRGGNVGAGGRAQVTVELIDEALAGQDDDDRARDDERGGEQDPERQQQPRPERQATRVQAASARSV
jgi:hypothetical protein